MLVVVTSGSLLFVDGKEYKGGESLELDKSDAEALIHAGSVIDEETHKRLENERADYDREQEDLQAQLASEKVVGSNNATAKSQKGD